MADRRFQGPLQTLDAEVKEIIGCFAPQGAGAPTILGGLGWTVARTAAGVWALTLQDGYAKLLSAQLSLGLAVAADRKLQWGAINVTRKVVGGVAKQTAVINCLDSAGAAHDIAAAAGNQVMFVLKVKNLSVA